MSEKLTSIIYIIPYFGKFNDDFKLWLHSVEKNPTIDWLIVTDDLNSIPKHENLKCIDMSFEEFKKLVQKNFDFEITLDRPYKICDYRVAFGEIFQQYIQNYDWWGYCDTDMMWGNIRAFLSEDIIAKYDKIGFQGHSTIYKNNTINNSRYRKYFDDEVNYRTVFTEEFSFNFDEKGINAIFSKLGVDFYYETNFSTLAMYRNNFIARYWDKEKVESNKNVVYFWENGKLYHVATLKNKLVFIEVMYVHWQKRKIELDTQLSNSILIVPNRAINYLKSNISCDVVLEHSKTHWFSYTIKYISSNINNGIIYTLKCLKRLLFYNARVSFKNYEKQDLRG